MTTDQETNRKIPAIFFAHGSPALLEESGMRLGDRMGSDFEGGPSGAQAKFLKKFGDMILQTYKPNAIVVFSAHWETQSSSPIQIMDNTAEWQSKNLYYDYYGFPK